MKKNTIGRTKTKRVAAVAAAALALILVCGACGAKGAGYNASAPREAASAEEKASAAEDSYWDEPAEAESRDEEAATEEAYAGETAVATGEDLTLREDKLVHTCRLQIQTLTYTEDAAAIRAAVKAHGGIIEDETETNDEYSWYETYWHGDESDRSRMDLYLTVRVPTDDYETFVEEISGIGKVLSKTQSTDNISRAYYDTETRIKALEIEEERLLEMMKAAETVEEMILVEERLTEVQHTLNSERGWLAEMDTDVAYSTVVIELREVREFSPGLTDPTPTFAQRVRNAFGSAWDGFLSFLESALYVLIHLLPFLVIGLVVFLIVWFATRKRRRAKKEARRAQAEARSAQAEARSAQAEQPTEK